MAILTALTGEKIVCGPIWDGTGAADPAHGSGKGQIWSPTAVALSANRFVVAALYDNDAGYPPDYARYMLIDETGTVLQTTDLPYLTDPVGLITLDETHLLETAGTYSSTPRITVRRISVSDSTGFTVDYVQTTTLPSTEGHESTFAANKPQVYVQSQGFVVQAVDCYYNHYYPNTANRLKLRAIDATNGNVLWTQYETVNWGDNNNGRVDLAVSGADKVTVSWGQNSHWTGFSTTSTTTVVTQEFTVTGTGATPTGDPVTFDSGAQPFYAAMFADPYQAGKPGYLRFDQHTEDTYEMEFQGVLGNTQQCTTGRTASYGLEKWPYYRPIQQGLPFVPFAFMSYDANSKVEGVRTVCWDPLAGQVEVSDPYRVTLFGSPGDYATWVEDSEVRGGGCSMAFDPVSGVGIMAVTWVFQQTNATSQYLQMSVWMLQGPSNKPNLSATPQGVEVHFVG